MITNEFRPGNQVKITNSYSHWCGQVGRILDRLHEPGEQPRYLVQLLSGIELPFAGWEMEVRDTSIKKSSPKIKALYVQREDGDEDFVMALDMETVELRLEDPGPGDAEDDDYVSSLLSEIAFDMDAEDEYTIREFNDISQVPEVFDNHN